MKLEPEEFVKRLIAHLEAKSETARAAQVDALAAGGDMTARVLPFQPAVRRYRKAVSEPTAVLSLTEAREARASARTVSGVFVYTARL